MSNKSEISLMLKTKVMRQSIECPHNFQQNPYLCYDRIHTILIYQHLAMISPK